MKEGESFNGEYKKRRHIPYFDNYTIVDLLPDMKEMGCDFDELVNWIRNKNIRYNRENNTDWDTEPIIHGEHNHYLNLPYGIPLSPDDLIVFEKKMKPFESGIATLYGSIKFDDSDFTVDFVAEISLCTSGGFGALSYANDKFDVKLKSFGNDYKLRYPYTTVIEPNGTEMIKLILSADKSSSHKFHVEVKNDNGLKIRSKNIHFHHYYPKN